MARAYCEKCKVITKWRAGRGARIRHVRCRVCGGPVRAHRHEDIVRYPEPPVAKRGGEPWCSHGKCTSVHP